VARGDEAGSRRAEEQFVCYHRRVNCYILAGGLSRRMGSPKPDLLLGGRTFLERVVEAARPVFEEVVIVTREPMETIEGIRTLQEPLHDDAASIYGVEAALRDSAHTRMWVLAVDYPLITAEVLQVLADEYEQSFAELFVPMWEGRPQLLCAGWAKTLWKPVTRQIREGDLSLRSLLDAGRTEILEEPMVRARFRGNPFRNVNTREDYETLNSDMEREESQPKLSHLDGEGRVAMVDVGEKEITRRRAVATGFVSMSRDTLDLIRREALPKGDVLATARVAGIMAAKKTSELVPLTHPLLLDRVSVELRIDQERCGVGIETEVLCSGRTGVEIEAMTACAVAALTIYDMCKSVEKGITIESIVLEEKSGGKSDFRRRG
jgi:cyclic pyranopterin monophosphate synthase